METANSEQRAGERRTRPRLQNRRSFAELSLSSLPPKSSQKKKRKKATPSTEFYLVKGILAEKKEAGKTLYYIDWEDNQETGQPYSPTWEPYENITEEALADWEAKKGEGDPWSRNSLAQSSAYESLPDSQPPHPAKRQRISRPFNPTTPSQASSKKPRRVGTAETARFQSVSPEETFASRKHPPSEVKDSYDEDQQLSNDSGRIRVVVAVNEDFDRDAYAKFSIQSSQPSQQSQSSHLSPFSQPQSQGIYISQASQSSTSQPQLHPAAPRSILSNRDEELGESQVIPDSQEPGSSSYKHSDTSSSSISGGALQPTARTSTEVELLSPLSFRLPETSSSRSGKAQRSTVTNSGRDTPSQERRWELSTYSSSIDYRRSAPPSYRPGPRASSSRREASAEATSSGELQAGLIRGTSEQGVLPPQGSQELDRFAAEDSRTLSVSERRDVSDSDIITNPPLLSDIYPASQITRGQGTWSEGPAPSPDRVQPQQRSSPDVYQSTDLTFQTQLPVASSGEDSSPSAEGHVIVESNQSLHSNAAQHSQQSLSPTTQSPTSSSETTWQAAQAVSPIPRPSIEISSTQQTTTTYLESQRFISEGPSLQDVNFQVSAEPALIQLGVNTSNRDLVVQADLNSRETSEIPEVPLRSRKSNILSTQTSENILASIEQDTSSLPLTPRPPPLSSSVLRFSTSYESNSPSRPSLPANANMADETMSDTLSVTEMLKKARATAAANAIARQAERRTASAIPSTPLPAMGQMLPLREPAQDVPALVLQSITSPKASTEPESIAKGLQILPLGPMEYVVPVPMNSITRDIYDQEIKGYKRQIEEFQRDQEVPLGLAKEIDTMINRLKMLCDHQSLIEVDFATQEEAPDREISKWATTISTKCMFLVGILEALRPSHEHVVVFSRPGRMISILEALFRFHGFRYNRPDRLESFSETEGTMEVTLVTTDYVDTSNGFVPASLVIAFDSTFDQLKCPEILRYNSTMMAPTVHLVVAYSVEHLEMCLDKNLVSLDRATVLVNCLLRVRKESILGILSTEYPVPEEAGRAIAAFTVAKDPERLWPLLPMPEIDGIELGIESTPQPDIKSVESISGSGNTTSLAPTVQAGFKRPLGPGEGFGEDSESSKRPRLSPLVAEQSSGIDNSDLSDTVLGKSSSDRPSSIIDESNHIYITSGDGQDGRILSLLKKVAHLEDQLRSKNATEAQLRQQNRKLEVTCEDQETSLANIRPKYQEALNDRGEFEHELSIARANENSMREKHDLRMAELTKAREEKVATNAELCVARTALSTSAIPEIAAFSKLKEELITVRKENERLQKRLASLQSEAEYMRGNYQNASSAAADAVNELNELKEENEVLQRKASDNARRIHEIQASNEIKQHLETVEQLEAEMAEKDRELEKKNEELRALLNGRRQTRGTSVPRSPRMGTMSPGQRPISRVLSGVGSRGNSPAPGDGAPFRGTFSDALFQPPGSNRWGNHLV